LRRSPEQALQTAAFFDYALPALYVKHYFETNAPNKNTYL